MFCDEVLEIVEPIAAGERPLSDRVAAHLQSCANCTAALEGARRVERALRGRPVPKAPAQFTARTLGLLRRQRWRSEQYLDTGFNLALALIAIMLVGTMLWLLSRSGLVTVGGDAVDLFSVGFKTVARRIAPSLPLYAGAMGLLAMALGLWWWAERGSTT